MTNPLIELSDQPDNLPCFNKISASDFLSAVQSIIDQSEIDIENIVSGANPPEWQNLLLPLEKVYDKLERAWSVISHLNGVANTAEVREAYSACLPVLTEFNTKMGQHQAMFTAIQSLRNSDAYSSLNSEQKKVVENNLRDFKLAGVDLPEAKQKRYAQIKKQLAGLTTNFSNNVLDATRVFTRHISDKQDLQGLPEMALEAAESLAREKNLDGYLLTLDIPSYLPVMQYCENASLRKEMYLAYVTRASEIGSNAGEFDNSENMQKILALRLELAKLLGFNNYAELSIEAKMAESTSQVVNFLQELADKTVAIAKKEYAELEAFARDEISLVSLNAWDVPFVSEKLRVARYAISQETIRPYFPVDKVIAGMFEVVHRLYGISIEAATPPSTWHEDVRFYHVSNAKGELQAQFYLDLFAREGKRGGAWMADFKSRRRVDSDQRQLPVAFLVCNFTPPAEGSPSLLTHNEVTTLFHEFGHGLHHMLTQIDAAGVAGINGVAWDAVELPSQFMENWCWEEEALALFSSHYETGEPLPKTLLDKMLAAKNFQSGMQMVRQIEFALFDFLIHKDFDADDWQGIAATLAKVRKDVAAYPVHESNRFQHSFSHIFAGGYAAGYYSYKWAEVLSADAYSLFEQNGIFDADTGQKFHDEILSRGGSKEPAELFKNFRGREANTKALLRHSGIESGIDG